MSKTLKNTLACLLSFVMLFVFTACDDNEEAEKKGDFISGYKWTTSENMMLDLQSNNTFKWYSSSSNRSDNYYSGTFETLVGQKAVDYLVENAGAAEDGQIKTMNEYGVALNEYYILILNNEECIREGKNVLEEKNTIIYVGFYKEKYESLTLTNLTSGTEYIFKKM